MRVDHRVVAARVQPEVRQAAHPQHADVGVLVVAHQRRDAAAVQRLGGEALGERGAVARVPEVAVGIGERREPALRVRRRVAGHVPLATACARSRRRSAARTGSDACVLVVHVEVRLDVLRVPRRAVVALAVVLPDELPVRVDLVLDGLGDARAVEALRRARLDEPPAQARRTRGRFGERHVDEAGHHFGVHGLQAQRGLVDAVVHAVACDQLAVARVRPAVIRADDRAQMPGVLAAELGAAVAADVVERAHGAVVAADHQRRVSRRSSSVR